MSTSFDSTLSSLGIQRTGSTSSSTTTSSSSSSNNMIDQTGFLKLLTAQLQNQDPTSPADTNQMVSQLAEITSASSSSETSSTLKEIQTQLNAGSTSDALSYVGKTVLTAGDTAYARTSGGIAGAVELDSAASAVKVTIQSSTGETLKTIDLGAQSAGTVSYDWDGTTDGGASAGDGPFKVSVTATDSEGAVTAKSLVWAPVSSVSLSSGSTPTLNVLGVGQVAPSAVRQVG